MNAVHRAGALPSSTAGYERLYAWWGCPAMCLDQSGVRNSVVAQRPVPRLVRRCRTRRQLRCLDRLAADTGIRFQQLGKTQQAAN